MRCFPVSGRSITWRMMIKSPPHLWNDARLRIGRSRSTMTHDGRMQRESSLIATIRKNPSDFAKGVRGRHGTRTTSPTRLRPDYQEDE
jgi:hypothetical protein